MKKIMSYLLLFVVVLSFTACGKQSAGGIGPTTLTIACWIKDYPLVYSVEKFNQRNNNYRIEIHEYYDENALDYKAAMTRMQADLISNSKVDLLYLDSMDIYALENAGLLKDLLPLMEKDHTFKVDDYYWNIWNQYQRNGKLYEWIPAFELTGVFGPSCLLDEIDRWTIEEYLEFVKMNGQEISNCTPEIMINYMLQFTRNNLIDLRNGSCELDSQEFQFWLEFAKDVAPCEGGLFVDWISGMNAYLSWQHSFHTPIRLVNIPNTQTCGVCASAHFSFGISSKTENVSACWGFLKLLMEDDVLNDVTLGIESVGFPMKKEVMHEQLERAKLDAADVDSLVYNWGDDAAPMTEEESVYMINLLENIDCVQGRFSAVLDIVSDEAQAFFNGDKSVEETTEIIQSRVSIYLSEQQ